MTFHLRQTRAVRRWLALPLLAVVTACSAPTQQFPGSKADGAYFAAPREWRNISFADLQRYEKSSSNPDVVDRASMVRYEIALTPSKEVSAKDVFSLAPVDQPVAFMRIRDLFPEEINSASYNSLRSVLVPLSRMVTNPQTGDAPFDLIDDFEVADKGGRGVRTIYRITLQGQEQVIDQTAVTSDDRRTLYVFVIRCTTECYNKNEKLMTTIADSFSVKGPR